LELRIEDVAFGGKGVARAQGKAVFIPFTIDGERVSARIMREKKNFAEAEVEEIIGRSSHRVAPECPYFGSCGGCSYQHIDYGHQLELKTRQVEQTLKRIGHLSNVPMRPMIGSSKSYAYRNRITVHCENGVIGFYRRDEHRLIDVELCPITQPEVNEELRRLRASRPRDGHYTLRASDGSRIFSQTNDLVAEQLLKHVDDLVSEPGGLLIDAYCGAGFFAKRLLNKFDRVIGIDWDRFAIAEAKTDAAEKEIYLACDVDSELQSRSGGLQDAVELSRRPGDRRSLVLIVDPPATGLTSKTCQVISELAPDPLIYISCNPPILARDLARLHERFTIESITPFDMFPQTAEIEVVVKLSARAR
jgi:23S rRNA (uracil1939-C5)-methyltransferase